MTVDIQKLFEPVNRIFLFSVLKKIRILEKFYQMSKSFTKSQVKQVYSGKQNAFP